MLEERGMLSTTVVPRSQRKYPAHSATLAVSPAAPLSAVVAFFFFAICLDNKKERLFLFLLSKGISLMRLKPCPCLPAEGFFLPLEQLEMDFSKCHAGLD